MPAIAVFQDLIEAADTTKYHELVELPRRELAKAGLAILL